MRVLYVQAAESMISMRNTAAANRDIMIAHGDMGRRRMAAAYELMELSQMKETQIPDPNMSTIAAASSDGLDVAASTVAAAPAAVSSTIKVAAVEIALPPQDVVLNTESQWTFGPTLTAQEIIK